MQKKVLNKDSNDQMNFIINIQIQIKDKDIP